MTARVTVHCTACDWRGQRLAESALEDCPSCESAVVRAPTRPGPQPAPPDERRVEMRARVLPSTAAALTAREAAEILDRAAKRRA